MRSPVTGIVALILLFVVVIVGYSSVFTVQQTEQALVVRLGEPVARRHRAGPELQGAVHRHRDLRSTSASSTWKIRRRK